IIPPSATTATRASRRSTRARAKSRRTSSPIGWYEQERAIARTDSSPECWRSANRRASHCGRWPAMSEAPPEWEFTERDVVSLRELAGDPQVSSRQLTEILDEKYDIDVSHVTVSESIRRMREEGVFREAIIPNEDFFIFGLFEFKFNAEHFADEWRAAMEYIRDSPN